MSETEPFSSARPSRSGVREPWDARLARRLVERLVQTRVTPNHLTTVRLAAGLAAAAAFVPGTYGWSNIGALLLVSSNFLDHADGELARMSGKSSRFGHLYDLASDAAVTILLFIAMGVGVGSAADQPFDFPLIGAVAGFSIAFIFYFRMRMEALGGKAVTRQASLGGFEAEDVLYLLPLVTLSDGLRSMLVTAACCAPLYALWTVIEYRGVVRRGPASNRGEAR